MLSLRFAQGSLSIASSSKFNFLSAIHTSTVVQAVSHRKRQSRLARKSNTAKREERERVKEANRPHVVLGTLPGKEAAWQNCDLAQVLVDDEALANSAELVPTTLPYGTVSLPKKFGHGVGDVEKKLLFQHLPTLSAEASFHRVRHTFYGAESWASSKLAEAEEKELTKAKTFAAVLDLRNANAEGIAYENRKRIIATFSELERPFDTGRPEVQAALLTYKIRNLWRHLTQFKRDVGNRRSLRKLVHQRAKILKYLKEVDRDRYDAVLSRLALEPASVEGELVV